MNLRPLHTKVALKEVNKDNKTHGGIVLVGGSDETPEFGVVAIGPEVDCVQVGDRVLIEIGKASVVNGDTLIIESEFITAVLND